MGKVTELRVFFFGGLSAFAIFLLKVCYHSNRLINVLFSIRH